MNRLNLLVALGLALAGCTAGAPATQMPTADLPTHQLSPLATSVPTFLPTPRKTTAPTPNVTPTPIPPIPTATLPALPENLTAHQAAGDLLPYLEYLPPGYADDDSLRPLLIFLHGAGEYGDGSVEQLAKVLSLGIPTMIANGSWPAEHPFVVLMPQYYFAPANGACDIGDELERFIGHALSTYKVDANHVYLTGISCGAIGIYHYLSEEREYPIAAVVPISGQPSYVMDKAGCELVRTPTWAFNGALDEIIPIDWLEEKMAALAACTDPPPTDLIFTVYPKGHHDADTWDVTYDLSAGHDIYTWMRIHRAN